MSVKTQVVVVRIELKLTAKASKTMKAGKVKTASRRGFLSEDVRARLLGTCLGKREVRVSQYLADRFTLAQLKRAVRIRSRLSVYQRPVKSATWSTKK